MWILILLMLALVLFFLAAINTPSQHINLVAAGLFFWMLTLVIRAWHG